MASATRPSPKGFTGPDLPAGLARGISRTGSPHANRQAATSAGVGEQVKGHEGQLPGPSKPAAASPAAPTVELQPPAGHGAETEATCGRIEKRTLLR